MISESPGQAAQGLRAGTQHNENSNPVHWVPVPEEMMRIGETLFWFLRYLVLISIFPTQFPFTIVELKFWLIHTTVSALSCAGKKILRKFSCSVRVCHNWEGLVTCWRFGLKLAETQSLFAESVLMILSVFWLPAKCCPSARSSYV